MKRTCLFSVLVVLLAVLLAACGPGSLGNEGIAFVRDGKLWTIDPNGANAFVAVAQSTPVLGYGLSPNHQIFVFRALDGDFAKTSAGRNLVINPLTGLAGDMPSSLSTVGIDGGSPIPIILSDPHLARSNAWWSPNGTHLLYREGADPNLASPDLVKWWISQDDQPVGIARKLLPNSYSILSLNSASLLAVGNSEQGIFTAKLDGTNFTFIQRAALPGHPLPASLERLLWQPAHQNPALLFALSPATQSNGPTQFLLVLHEANGQTRTLTSCTCRQFAWSPDGNRILYSTDQGYSVLNIADNTTFHFTAEHEAVPYWSPDSRALLLDGLHTLTLVSMKNQQAQVLLSDGNAPVLTDNPLPSNTTFLQPVANSLWNVDSQRVVLITRGRTQWQGQQLSSSNGLYMVSLNGQDASQGIPALVDSNGHDTQPGWSYEDPNTSFLF
ncbi:MAG: hypothetical protein ABI234_00220 [Ktedonobacteraceae bacterium]